MEIKIALIKLSKTQVDLINELRERGFTINKGELCEFINKYDRYKKSPKSKIILAECNNIIKEWKKQSKKKKGN